jgi:hypothetical protein
MQAKWPGKADHTTESDDGVVADQATQRPGSLAMAWPVNGLTIGSQPSGSFGLRLLSVGFGKGAF